VSRPKERPGSRDPRTDVARERRSTFLSVRDVLKRLVEVLRAVRLHLQAIEPADERDRLFASALINRRSKLEYAIGQCVQEAPRSVLDTFVQYAADAAEAGPAIPPRRDPEALMRWQTEADASLVRILEGLSERVENEACADLFRAIARLLRTHDQNVARELEELRDL